MISFLRRRKCLLSELKNYFLSFILLFKIMMMLTKTKARAVSL